MSRRRFRTPPKPFNDAYSSIDKLERAVVAKTVHPEFNIDQLLLAMYGEEVVDKLRAAFPYVQERDQSYYLTEQVRLSPEANHPPGPYIGRITVAAKSSKFLVPEAGRMLPSIREFHPLVETLMATLAQHLKFEKLRSVVGWLNECATPGAALNYCPWIKSLIPDKDHEVHTITSANYREPKKEIGPMIQTMRECHDIVAMALLAGTEVKDCAENFRIVITGERIDHYEPLSTIPYHSQSFEYEI